MQVREYTHLNIYFIWPITIWYFFCSYPCFEVQLWFCLYFFNFVVLPFIFHSCDFALIFVYLPLFWPLTGVKPHWFVNSKEKNHKVKKIRAKSQLHFKVGARTQMPLFIYHSIIWDELLSPTNSFPVPVQFEANCNLGMQVAQFVKFLIISFCLLNMQTIHHMN